MAVQVRRQAVRAASVLGLVLLLSAVGAGFEASDIVNFFTEGANPDDTEQLFFGVVVPFLMFFAIFHHLLRESGVLDDPSDTVVSIAFALFATRAAGPTILEAIQRGLLNVDLPNVLAGLSMAEKAAIALFLGGVLPYLYFHHRSDDGSLTTAELFFIPFATSVIWLFLAEGQGLEEIYLWGAVFGLGIFCIWAFGKTGGATGTIAGVVGLYILAWGINELDNQASVPGILVDISELIMGGFYAMLLLAIVGVFVVIFLLHAHAKHG